MEKSLLNRKGYQELLEEHHHQSSASKNKGDTRVLADNGCLKEIEKCREIKMEVKGLKPFLNNILNTGTSTSFIT